MSNKQLRGKLTRQEAEDKRIVLLMKYNMQNGFLNWGKLEMECDDLSWKKVLTRYSDRLLSFVLNSQLLKHSANTKQSSTMGLGKEFELWALRKI